MVDAKHAIPVANQQVTRWIADGFGGDGFERDFRANAGDIAQRNANPASH